MKPPARLRWALACIAFIAGIVIALVSLREPMDTLSVESLEAARQRWRAAGMAVYEITYRMHGSVYAVQWRDGRVTKATVNDLPPTTPDLNVYSVSGLFDTLEQELENFTDPAGPFAGRAETIIARVRFHPTLGYVERYLRSSSGQVRGASIEVINFSPRD